MEAPPPRTGFLPVSSQAPVPVGDKVSYTCDDSTKIPDVQNDLTYKPPFEVQCGADGEMDYPPAFPTCRDA